MTRAFRETMIERGDNPVRVEEGRIINVNMKRWTADVRTNERVYLDIPWANPYLHFAAGEGITFMPEVGAKVKVCRPSESDPFIMCFITPFERSARQSDDTDETPQVGTHSTQPSADVGGADVTYRAGRPNLQQGDILLRTRDGNAIWLRRGGVVEIGSTKISKRLYIPLLNYIRDICENYSLWSGGGVLTWTVTRSDTSPSDEANAVLSIAARNAAQDEQASVLLRIGHVDDSTRLRLVIAPTAINTRTFEVTEDAVYTLDVDSEGNVDETVKKDVNYTVSGELDWNVTGAASFRFSSDVNEEISGGLSTRVSGDHSFEASSSTERVGNSKIIDCSSIQLGGAGAVTPVVLATKLLMQYIVGHTHPVTGPATGPPTPTLPPSAFQATKVRGQ
jgi:hypothetical protein